MLVGIVIPEGVPCPAGEAVSSVGGYGGSCYGGGGLKRVVGALPPSLVVGRGHHGCMENEHATRKGCAGFSISGPVSFFNFHGTS